MSPFVQEMQALVARAKNLHATDRAATLESIEVIGKLDRMRASCVMGISSEKFAAHIGLTPSTYWRRAQVARVLIRFPKAREMVLSGETEVSHLALAAPKLSEASQQLVFEGIKDKSRREVAAFLSRVTLEGQVTDKEGTAEMKLVLTETQLKTLDRVREVLSARGKVPSTVELVMQAFDDLLAKRDPLVKAERAVKRAKVQEAKETPDLPPPMEKGASTPGEGEVPPSAEGGRRRTSMPAWLKHAVWVRGGGLCTHIFPDGSRCSTRSMVEMDHHNTPWCRGGEHSLENVGLKCRLHNVYGAELVLGREWMGYFMGSSVSYPTP